MTASGVPSRSDPTSVWARWVPGLRVVRGYRRAWLVHDLVGGLTLAALLVPQGMAYAALAGLPPVTGLYTTVTALVAYAAFGPSRILLVGPDSALAPLVAATILPLVGARGDPARAVALAGMLALMMGVVCLATGFARLGTIAELLSKPVRVGYLNGIAVIIVVSQLPRLFGFEVTPGDLRHELRGFARGLADGRTNTTALVIGVAALLVVLACRRWFPRVAGVLIAVVGATLAVSLFDLTAHGISVVGTVPTGFPTPTWPGVGAGQLGRLSLAAAGMAFVTLADSSALSRTYALRLGDTVDPNREIAGVGMANVAAGLFRGFPVSASATRTAVMETSGARTQIAGVVSAGVIAILLLAANELLGKLPLASLAAVIIAAAVSLFDLGALRWLWRVSRTEFLLSIAALAGVAVFGVLTGIVVAIGLSLANFVRRAWRPYDAVLGRSGDRKGYHDIQRHPEAVEVPGLLLYRFDAPLFFANAEHFARRLETSIAGRPDHIHWVVVAAEPISDVDTTGAEVLSHLLDDLDAAGTELAFAELKGPVKDRLRRFGLYERIGDDRFFPTLGAAVDGYLTYTGAEWSDPYDRRRERGGRRAGDGPVP